MTKYICTGECGGESDKPGVCQDPNCSKHGEPLIKQASSEAAEIEEQEGGEDVRFESEEESEEANNPAATIKRLRDKLKVVQKERQEFLETSQRLKADYVNFKKEEEKRREETLKFAKSGLLLELLDLADTFELAFSNKAAWESVNENWRRGVEYIYQKLVRIFEENGLESLHPLGEAFDPAKHHSVGQLATAKAEEDNKVLEVVQTGYQLAGRVVRPAKVKVGHYQA